MNETIGVKGGHNDQRRSMKIEKARKKKIEDRTKEEQIRQLEKAVKKNQIFTLVKALPIAIAGGTFKTLYQVGNEPIDKEEENSKWRIKEYDADITDKSRTEEAGSKKVLKVLPDGRKVIVTIPKEHNKPTVPSIIDDILIHPTLPTPKEKKQGEEKKEDSQTKRFEFVGKDNQQTKKKTGNPLSNDIEDYELYEETTNGLSNKSKDTILKLKNRKIIDEYEKQLKDVRYELRKLVADYNMLADQENEIIVSKEAQTILDRLSEIIERIETLKAKIKIDDLDKYDENYIYILVEGYLEEFKDKRLVAEIKDSPLYVMITDKLDELDKRREALTKKVENKKDDLEAKEIRFDEIKAKYINIDKINNQLLQFQDEQDRLLKEIEEKIRKAESVQEKVEVKIDGMTRQTRRAMRLLSLQMLLPGPRAAKYFAATSAAYLRFMQQMLNPRTTTRKYRVITVKDYSSEIKDSISQIDDAQNLLSKTSTQIDKIISEIKRDFSDYFGVVKECDELLSNLERIKRDLKEKEYEMEKTKEEQRKMLEKNDAKVLKRGTYPM